MIAGIDPLPDSSLDDTKGLEADVHTRRCGCLGIAQRLVRLLQQGLLPDLTFSTLAAWGARVGLSASEAYQLAEVGLAVAKLPALADDVRRGDLSIESAGYLGRLAKDKALYSEPPERCPGTPPAVKATLGPVPPKPPSPSDVLEMWRQTARSVTAKMLKSLVERRIEAVRAGHVRIVTMTLHTTEATRSQFLLARDIASRKAGTVLTEGQTLAAVVGHYLNDFDPGRVRPGKRRVASTARSGKRRESARGAGSVAPSGGAAARGRYVPAPVQREVRARSDGKCAHPGCPNHMFIELAHKVPHRDGGSRESDNLYGLCTRHHRAYDRGEFTIVGPMEAPTFIDGEGRRIAPNGRVIGQGTNKQRSAERREVNEPGNERGPP